MNGKYFTYDVKSASTFTEASWYSMVDNKWVLVKYRNEEQEKLKEIENMKEYEDLFE
jgi:hypothetical protein